MTERFPRRDGPVRYASAPGRVNLIGGHTDYNDGLVLPTAIDRRTVAAARPRDDGRIAVHSTNYGESVAFDLHAVAPGDGPAWAEYVKGVATRLRERGHEVVGCDLVVVGDVPIGGGLSSSAALEVAVADALAATGDLRVDDAELVTVGWEAENEFVGVGCGIMDQYAAVHAEPASALFLDCASRTHDVIPFPAGDAAVVVTDTNVRHDLVESAYNDRVATCAEGVERLDDRLDAPVDALADVSVDQFRDHAGALTDGVRARVRHVVTENERVREAAAALRDGDVERVGELLRASHASLRDDYEVSCPELDAVVDVAADLDGVYGSRMTGAGFGGSVVSLVAPDRTDAVAAAIRDRYRERTGVDAEVYACRPGGGVRRHDPP